MADAPPAEIPVAPLSVAELAEAVALYHELKRFWSSGVRQALVTRDRDGGLAVGSVNRRIQIRATLSQTN